MTPRDRRALLVGGAIVLSTWVSVKLIPRAWLFRQQLRENVASKATRLDRLEHDIAGLDSLEREAGRVRARLVGLAPRLLAARSHGEAGAELSVVLRTRAETAGARIGRITILPDSAGRGEPTEIRARIECETDAAGVEKLLELLASGNPVLVVSAVRVAAPAPRDRSEVMERLDVSIDVGAWWMAGGRVDSTGARS